MELFSTTCVTCRTRLKVRSLDAIGQILACPKCGGMVKIEPPPGWQPPVAGAPAGTFANGPTESNKLSSSDAATTATPQDLKHAASAPASSAQNAWTSDSQVFRREIAASAAAGLRQSFSDGLPSDSLTGGVEHAAVPPTSGSWLPWACVPLAGFISAAAMWWWLSSSSTEQQADVEPPAIVAVPADKPASPEAPTVPEPQAPHASEFALPWLPPETQLVLSLRLDVVSNDAGARMLVDRASSLGMPAVQPLLAAMDLDSSQVRRVTWASSDLKADGPLTGDAALCIVELHQPIADTKKWLARYERLSGPAGALMPHRARTGNWTRPLALLDARTIVTGTLDRLIAYNPPDEPHQHDRRSAVGRALASLDAKSPFLVSIDLEAARRASEMELDIPAELWNVRRNDWHVVRDLPLALGFSLGFDAGPHLSVSLPCASETEAEQVAAAAQSMTAGLKQTVSVERAALAKNLLSLPLTTATADQVDLLLAAGQQSLEQLSCNVRGEAVVVEARAEGDLAKLATAAMASVPALEQTRLAAARTVDQRNQTSLLEAMEGHRRKEGAYPPGAAGAALLPAETRLSWMAALLPYYGRFDWHRELKFGRPWNDAENQPVSRRPLDTAINPALGFSTTPAGFPVTHYVGVAGLGNDAAQLDAKNPRAGVFGDSRRMRLDDLADGASNTIAIAGVSGNLGPWASGGNATVRPFTAKPYIDGPDGFGSGQSQGLLVGMADGSVRWISKDIDPSVLEALVTANGHESVDDDMRRKLGWLATIAKPQASEPPSPVAQEPMPKVEPPTPAPPPGPRVDVAAKLSEPVPAVDFRAVPLEQFVEFVSQMSTVPISLDFDALAEVGVSPGDTVTVKLSGANVGQVLDAALHQRGLATIVHEGQIIISNPRRQRQTLETVRYDVADLLAAEPTQLMTLVTRFVDPSSWAVAGGHGSAKLEGAELVVKQSTPVQAEVKSLLESLRAARAGKPPLTRAARSRDKLDAKVTANFGEATSLRRILDYLENAAQVRLNVDAVALAAAGRTAHDRATLTVADQPLAAALDKLLAPQELAHEAIDEQTIGVTTRQALAAKFQLEFYPVASQLTADVTPDVLTERVKSGVLPKSWDDAGGGASIAYDAPSKCLLVWQTQAAQRQVEQLLATPQR